MPYIGQTTDLTTNNVSFSRVEDDFRAVAAKAFAPGTFVQLAPLDAQIYPDAKTVQPVPISGNQGNVMGCVSEAFVGFNGSIGAPSYTSPSSATTVRGTSGVTCVLAGYHSGVQIDQSGAGAATITNGTPLVGSKSSVGAAQGAAGTGAYAGLTTEGVAVLPATGMGSTLTAAVLAQASQTDTIAGAPAAGDTLTVTIQSPYNASAPGVSQTTSWTTPPLTSAQAASATTAAAALVAYLNAIPSFSQYFTATNAAGVVTVTVNALSTPFAVNFGSGTTVTAAFLISISGMVANSLSFAVSATGGSTATAGGATLAGGTGYKGTIPALVL